MPQTLNLKKAVVYAETFRAMIDERLFRQEWKRGATVKHIAALLHLNDRQVRYHRRKLGLPRRHVGNAENMMLVGFYVPCSLHTAIDLMAKEAGLHRADWLRNVVLEKLRR